MKRFSMFVVGGVFLVAMAAGCAKQPTQETEAAKSAVAAFTAEGADKYSAEDLKVLNDQLAAANDEIKSQEGKFMKNYDKAKEVLAKIKENADKLKAELPAKKEKAKNAAVEAQGAAKSAIEEAKALLANAPKGKGSKQDIEALNADVAGLEQSLNEVQGLIDGGDFAGATAKAAPIKDKAAEVSGQIKAALEKVGKKKK